MGVPLQGRVSVLLFQRNGYLWAMYARGASAIVERVKESWREEFLACGRHEGKPFVIKCLVRRLSDHLTVANQADHSETILSTKVGGAPSPSCSTARSKNSIKSTVPANPWRRPVAGSSRLKRRAASPFTPVDSCQHRSKNIR